MHNVMADMIARALVRDIPVWDEIVLSAIIS